MFQSRDEIRQVYLDVWSKMREKQLLEPMESLIALVIEQHPEYHPWLNSPETLKQTEFPAESGQSNPFMHMGMHIALREQAFSNRPSGIQSLHERLCKKLGQHDAEHAMMECLGQALWNAQRNNNIPDEQTYLDCLKKI
jgi:hypothetical protein